MTSAEERLTALTLEFVDALNNRNFDPSASPWVHVSDDALGTMLHRNSPERALIEYTVSLDPWLSMAKAKAIQYPELSFEALSCDIKMKHSTGQAISYCTVLSHGLLGDLTITHVARLEFTLRDGEWKLTKAGGSHGIQI